MSEATQTRSDKVQQPADTVDNKRNESNESRTVDLEYTEHKEIARPLLCTSVPSCGKSIRVRFELFSVRMLQ